MSTPARSGVQLTLVETRPPPIPLREYLARYHPNIVDAAWSYTPGARPFPHDSDPPPRPTRKARP